MKLFLTVIILHGGKKSKSDSETKGLIGGSRGEANNAAVVSISDDHRYRVSRP